MPFSSAGIWWKYEESILNKQTYPYKRSKQGFFQREDEVRNPKSRCNLLTESCKDSIYKVAEAVSLQSEVQK